jgi:hypothetical protein
MKGSGCRVDGFIVIKRGLGHKDYTRKEWSLKFTVVTVDA